VIMLVGKADEIMHRDLTTSERFKEFAVSVVGTVVAFGFWVIVTATMIKSGCIEVRTCSGVLVVPPAVGYRAP
jgi:hypothetical protein